MNTAVAVHEGRNDMGDDPDNVCLADPVSTPAWVASKASAFDASEGPLKVPFLLVGMPGPGAAYLEASFPTSRAATVATFGSSQVRAMSLSADVATAGAGAGAGAGADGAEAACEAPIPDASVSALIVLVKEAPELEQVASWAIELSRKVSPGRAFIFGDLPVASAPFGARPPVTFTLSTEALRKSGALEKPMPLPAPHMVDGLPAALLSVWEAHGTEAVAFLAVADTLLTSETFEGLKASMATAASFPGAEGILTSAGGVPSTLKADLAKATKELNRGAALITNTIYM